MIPYPVEQDRADIYPHIRASVRRVGRRVFIDVRRFDSAIAGEELDPGAHPEFMTIRQVVERHPCFTEAALRQLIARAERIGVAA